MGTLYEVDNNGIVKPLSSSSNPVATTGGIYYNNSSNTMRFHNGTSWVDMIGVLNKTLNFSIPKQQICSVIDDFSGGSPTNWDVTGGLVLAQASGVLYAGSSTAGTKRARYITDLKTLLAVGEALFTMGCVRQTGGNSAFVQITDNAANITNLATTVAAAANCMPVILYRLTTHIFVFINPASLYAWTTLDTTTWTNTYLRLETNGSDCSIILPFLLKFTESGDKVLEIIEDYYGGIGNPNVIAVFPSAGLISPSFGKLGNYTQTNSLATYGKVMVFSNAHLTATLPTEHIRFQGNTFDTLSGGTGSNLTGIYITTLDTTLSGNTQWSGTSRFLRSSFPTALQIVNLGPIVTTTADFEMRDQNSSGGNTAGISWILKISNFSP